MDPRNLVDGVELLRQHYRGKKSARDFRRHLCKIRECGFDDQPARAVSSTAETRRQVDRHRAAERVPIDESTRGIAFTRHDPVPARTRVRVHRGLRRQVSIALAEAAIIDREYRKAELMQLRNP